MTGRHGPMLDLPALTFGTGECVLVAGDPGHGHTALALAASGRLAPDAGTVTLTTSAGSTTRPDALRAVTAVVDLPEVSAPDEVLTVGTVVSEELALARRPSGPRATRAWLERHDLLDRRDTRVEELDGPLRTALLTSLAAERADVRLLVLVLPDRHGGDPAGWWSVAQAFAARGYGVLVQCTRSSARHLGIRVPATRGDVAGRAAPVEATRAAPGVAPAPEPPTTRELPAVPQDAGADPADDEPSVVDDEVDDPTAVLPDDAPSGGGPVDQGSDAGESP
ncbi:hypothetical protein [Cellulomonas wangsupingiae]|uniref:hypothetical protein n=1 Tax=Cellulomonas wangsupingiae TaxID=2968085 RepID=UPI001D0DCF65|nr:hypothetical protein [Cellulomonas wangsupingiae]MCM0641319.1 hypothetical protein [Cellulomonas wangsupingiae]